MASRKFVLEVRATDSSGNIIKRDPHTPKKHTADPVQEMLKEIDKEQQKISEAAVAAGQKAFGNAVSNLGTILGSNIDQAAVSGLSKIHGYATTLATGPAGVIAVGTDLALMALNDSLSRALHNQNVAFNTSRRGGLSNNVNYARVTGGRS